MMPFIHTTGLKPTPPPATTDGTITTGSVEGSSGSSSSSTQGSQGEELYFQVDMSDLFAAAGTTNPGTATGGTCPQTCYTSRDMSVTIDLAEERCWATVDNPSYSFHAYTSLKLAIDDCVSVLEDTIAMQTLLLESGSEEKIHCHQLMSG
jgi:hypothetical protein